MPKVFAISDLHLGFSCDKPMNIFGNRWENHEERLYENWQATVGKDDIVLVPGDISWETYVNRAVADFDFIIDAVDTVTAKLEIITKAKQCGTAIISCMGTGNKMDITKLIITDISKTEGCPLARVMRKELRNRGIEHLPVVFSPEKPFLETPTGELKGNRPAPASAIFVPAAAGLILAEEAIKHIIYR